MQDCYEFSLKPAGEEEGGGDSITITHRMFVSRQQNYKKTTMLRVTKFQIPAFSAEQ